MLKILIISYYYEPDISAGSFRVKALVKALLDQLPYNGHVEVITTFPSRYSSFNSEALEFECEPRLTIKRIRTTSHNNGMITQSKAFIRFAKGVISLCKYNNYDLVFATSSRLMTATLAAYLSRQINVKLYLDIRDIFVDTIKDVLPIKIGWVIKPVFSFLERWTISSASKVNLVSGGFLPYFRMRYSEQNFTLFTNGIDDEFIENQPLGNVKPSSKILNVIYAGNMGEGQRLDEIVPQLAKRFSGCLCFKLIGDGGKRKQLVDAIDKLNIKNVDILPPMKRDKLIEMYKKADILFLHLNDHEAFKKVLPSKLFEYGALGKPIWAGVSGFPAEFIKENIPNACIFLPCNLDDAIKSFKNLKIVTKSRDVFVKKYTRSKIMQQMAKDIIMTAKVK